MNCVVVCAEGVPDDDDCEMENSLFISFLVLLDDVIVAANGGAVDKLLLVVGVVSVIVTKSLVLLGLDMGVVSIISSSETQPTLDTGCSFNMG